MMTPDEILAAKELAERARATIPWDFHAVLRSAKNVDALCDTALTAIAERDAAMAVLREARGWVGELELRDRIDALLKDKSGVMR